MKSLKKISSLIALCALLTACGATEKVTQLFGTESEADIIEAERELALENIPELDFLNKQWSDDIGNVDDSYLLAAIDGNSIYTVDTKGRVQALDLNSGNVQWNEKVKIRKAQVQAGVSVGPNYIYFVDSEGVLYAVNKVNGSLAWQTSLGGEVLAPPAANDKYVVSHTVDGRLIVSSSLTGEEAWVYVHEQPGLTLRGNVSPILIGNLVLTGFDDGRLVANDMASGFTMWDFEVGRAKGDDEIQRLIDIDAQPIIDDSGVVYISAYQGRTTALDIRNGSTVWRINPSTRVQFDRDRSNLYMINTENELLAIGLQKGQLVWGQKHEFYGDPIGVVSAGDNALMIADNQGYIYRYQKSDGRLLGKQRLFKSATNPPLYINNTLLWMNDKGDLAAYSIN